MGKIEQAKVRAIAREIYTQAVSRAMITHEKVDYKALARGSIEAAKILIKELVNDDYFC